MSGQELGKNYADLVENFIDEMKYIDLIDAISSCGVHHSSWSKIYHADTKKRLKRLLK